MSVHVPNCKSFLVTQAEKKHVRRRARFQQHGDASCLQVFFPLQGKASKKIHAILTEILGEHAPSYATVKNWVAQFECGYFSTCDALRPGRHKTVTIPEIIDKIHKLILQPIRNWPTWASNVLITHSNLLIFFLSGLQKLEQRSKRFIELRGEYVE